MHILEIIDKLNTAKIAVKMGQDNFLKIAINEIEESIKQLRIKEYGEEDNA